MKISSYIVPLAVAAIVVFGVYRGCNVFELFMRGAKNGMKTVLGIAPAMFAIMLALGVFKTSGALDLFISLLSPVVSFAGFPEEVLPLMLLRPISGAGALAVFKDTISTYGPDSFVGRVVSVMQGSTETTFYTMAVYYAATRVKNTRHTLKAALAGDMTGYVMSLVTVIILFGR